MMDPNAPQPPPQTPYLPPAPPPVKKGGMGAGLILALGCFGFLALGFAGIVVLAALSGGDNNGGGRVEDQSVLRMKLFGGTPEYVRSSGLDELFGGSPVTVRQHVFNLEKAAADKRIKGVLLEMGTMDGTGWAKIEELRDAIVEFKKSGKFVIVFSEALSEREYALAIAADTIVMPRDSWFEFNGLASDISHYPGLLEKLGVEVQYFRYGKYKSVSGEQTGSKAFTEPVKEMIRFNMDATYNHLVEAVARFRKLEPEKVKALIEEGHTKSDWAFEQKLIDQLGYQDEVEALIRTKLGLDDKTKIPYVSASRYRNIEPSEAGLEEGKHTIALIYSVGLIVSGKGSDDPFGGDSNQGSEPLIRALRKAAADDEVKAIIMRVDSPGGAGLGCDYVRREVALARAKKPVIVSMSDVAASGGYWVSMDATAIVAQPTTSTGSIGIYTVVPSLGGLYEKLGLNNETFKVGEHADMLIAARKFSDDEARQWDTDLFASYNRFVSLAAEGRKMDKDKMQELAQGRTWLGSDAKENGLIDELGGFPAAIKLAREKASIPAGETVALKLFDRKKTFLEELLNRDNEDEESPELAVTLLSKTVEASGLRPLFKKVPGLSGLTREVVTGKNTLFPMAEYQVDYR
ncbi:MAG: signal peptide peptidase SppA [Archangium sp.]|nr:signal peptide peptidase SppA [Archangium sp.]MDP3575097.1 signal peptide peptidase SppA [Archangium sp.]